MGNNKKILLTDFGKVENLSEENFEKVYFVLRDIQKQIELGLSDQVKIYLVVPREKAKGYFAWDRKLWKGDIVELLNYLKKLEVIKSYTFPKSELYADVVLNVDKYRKIYKSAEKRNSLKYHRIIKFEPLDKPNGKLLANYDSETGLLTIGDKKAWLQKDAFSTRMLVVLLKNPRNKKKIWSWDEIVEVIEDVNTSEDIKKYRGKFKNACYGLKKTIAAKTGIIDLLIFTETNISINSKFF